MRVNPPVLLKGGTEREPSRVSGRLSVHSCIQPVAYAAWLAKLALRLAFQFRERQVEAAEVVPGAIRG